MSEAWACFKDDETCAVVAQGEGWMVWKHLGDSSLNIVVRSDDGKRAKGITVKLSNAVDDMLASAEWVAALSPTEKDRALAAVSTLEAVDA